MIFTSFAAMKSSNKVLQHFNVKVNCGFPLQMPSTEPFKMDTLSLALTGGPNGYRINLKDMEVFGASNFTVKTIK